MRVDTTVLASEVIGGGVNKGGMNSFSGEIYCKCNLTSEDDKEGKE